MRWSSFNSKIGAYQGELINKEAYARAFLDQRRRVASYRYENIAAVLDAIVAAAVAMREQATAESFRDTFDDRLKSL